MDKWLAKFKENNSPETPNQGTDITDNRQKIDCNDIQPRQDHPEPPAETPAALYMAVSDKLAATYQAGTREYIEQHRPELAQEIDAAEAEVNRSWLACEDGTDSLDAFKQALETWRQANLKAIRAYNDTLLLSLAGADPAEEARAKKHLRQKGFFLMHSRALGERIAVIEHDRCRQSVPRGVPVYTLKEIRLLQQGVEDGNIVTITDLRTLHTAKRTGVIVK